MDKSQRRVLKEFPNAKPVYTDEGIVIMSGEREIAQDYFMPATSDIQTAWEHAALACKTTQNFNRTHPLRMSTKDIEKKVMRMRVRRRRAENAKKIKTNAN
jgi:hypothetical protein